MREEDWEHRAMSQMRYDSLKSIYSRKCFVHIKCYVRIQSQRKHMDPTSEKLISQQGRQTRITVYIWIHTDIHIHPSVSMGHQLQDPCRHQVCRYLSHL